MNINEKKWINHDEFEIIFNIKKSTQAKWRMSNKLPFSKIGKFIRYNKIEIDKLFELNCINNR